jgi:hypothetical protein
MPVSAYLKAGLFVVAAAAALFAAAGTVVIPGWLQGICLFTVGSGYALALWAMRRVVLARA